jgi:hypothetical protein
MYPWYDEKSRIMVVPIVADNPDKPFIYVLDNFIKIGCQLVEEIEIPVDLGVKFFRIILADDMIVEKEEDFGYRILLRDKIRAIVRLIKYFWQSHVFTKYYISENSVSIDDWGTFSIFDTEINIGAEVYDHDDKDAFNKAKIVQTLFKSQEEAEEWLDVNYPKWRDATAYWEQVDEKR